MEAARAESETSVGPMTRYDTTPEDSRDFQCLIVEERLYSLNKSHEPSYWKRKCCYKTETQQDRIYVCNQHQGGKTKAIGTLGAEGAEGGGRRAGGRFCRKILLLKAMRDFRSVSGRRE